MPPSCPDPYRRSFLFHDPVDAIQAAAPGGLTAALDAVQASVSRGLHAVGLVTYEAAPGGDAALDAHLPTGPLPPVWFGVYRHRTRIEASAAPTLGAGDFELGLWEPALAAPAHAAAVTAIRDAIGAGDVYQVNLTFPLRATFRGDPVALYGALCRAQGGAAFCSCLDLGEVAVLSASPELFFALDSEGRLHTRPMKGTRPRGRWTAEDDDLRRDLATAAKDRAENVMIVDLLRNDLGRVAVPGSVRVPSLWDVERYDTVWQMTSRVEARARVDVGLADLFAALFPCGSVTGAPKVQAARVIRCLEAGPRGLYTGAIGFVSPVPTGRGLEAVFAVAIRTVTVDLAAGRATAGVGGGITWDSRAAPEYAECLHKGRFLSLGGAAGAGEGGGEAFKLLETLLFEPAGGYYLLDRHLWRLAASARYFGIDVDLARVRAALAAAATGTTALRVRLTVARHGDVCVAARPAAPDRGPVLTAVLAPEPVDTNDVFLYHKTTRRRVYEEALAAARAAGADEVILHNERGELTECANGNLVLERHGRRWTPPQRCGLLAGTYREHLLERGEIAEAVLIPRDGAAAAWCVNSVHRWVRLQVRWPDGAHP